MYTLLVFRMFKHLVIESASAMLQTGMYLEKLETTVVPKGL